jgi:hypothetical protein
MALPLSWNVGLRALLGDMGNRPSTFITQVGFARRTQRNF